MGKRVPTAAEVALDHFHEFFGRNVAYVLIGEVGYSHDGALLDGKFQILGLVEAHAAHLKSTGFVFLDDLLPVDFHFLHLECTLDDVYIMLQIVFGVRVFLGCLQHPEDVVLLNVPDTGFTDCFQCQ